MKNYSIRKVVHKNLVNVVNSAFGIVVVIFSLVVTTIVIIRFVLLGVHTSGYLATSHQKQQGITIGGVDLKHFSQYPPIDAVYTWVNGSDPVWLNKKRHWARIHRQEMLLENLTATLAIGNIVFNISNSSHEMLLQLLSNSTEFRDDDATAANRYRDNDELKYSLRSLVRNAPWIRHVYIVTDNQVPSWLNLQSNHITVKSRHLSICLSTCVHPYVCI